MVERGSLFFSSVVFLELCDASQVLKVLVASKCLTPLVKSSFAQNAGSGLGGGWLGQRGREREDWNVSENGTGREFVGCWDSQESARSRQDWRVADPGGKR